MRLPATSRMTANFNFRSVRGFVPTQQNEHYTSPHWKIFEAQSTLSCKIEENDLLIQLAGHAGSTGPFTPGRLPQAHSYRVVELQGYEPARIGLGSSP